MQTLDQGLRVLRWRAHGLPSRLGQALIIGALLWLQLRSWTPFAWCALAMGTAWVDAWLSRRVLARPEARWLSVLNDATRVVSATAFTSVCFFMLADPSGFALAGSILAACAINLNNAVMSRGVRRYTLGLMGPPSAVLIALPLGAWATDHPLSLSAAVVLTLGAIGYTIFAARVAATLAEEDRALRAALDAAEAASRAKSDFLAVTSHEIRTPLNGVLGMAQAMENDELTPVQRERIGVIRHSGTGLLDLLNDILDLSKIEAGKLELDPAPFELEAVVRSAVDAFGASAANKGLNYRLDIEPSACGAYLGDAARVRQVLSNLISNAVKFTAEGSVILSVRGRPGGVLFSVTDTGPGLPPGFEARVFEKFVQADVSTTRRYGGTGLGLAISQNLCRAMGGTIAVERPAEGGARFVVDLPLIRTERVVPDAEAAPAAGDRVAHDRPIRALAAEDNSVNQLVLRTLLEQLGVEATIVADGSEAVDAWEAGEFDLILMDIQMPVMDGPEAARTIRAREAAAGRRRIPIIALTANVMSHQIEAYAEAGMDAFVAKPIAVAKLYAAIVEAVAPDVAADGPASQVA